MIRATSLRLSRMGSAVRESATLRQAARVGELRARGRTILNLTVGEPDCDMPEPVRRAAHHAIDAGHTRYTPSAGTPELRRAVAETYAPRHGLDWTASNVIVSAGVKQVLWTALAALIEPGDEVVLFAPYWVSYAAYVHLLGGVPRVVRTAPEADFKATGAELRAVLGPRTRAVLFNTPTNPTGAVYSRDELSDLFAPLLEHDAALLSDEIYEHMVYEAEHVSPLQVYPQLADRSLVVSGASKSYAMTGWRIGWGLGPEALVEAMTCLQSHMTGNPNSVAQRAALEALQIPAAGLQPMRDLFRRRRDVCLEVLQQIPELRFPFPHGAFYFFPHVQPFFGDWQGGRRLDSSAAVAEHLLETHGVAVVPGSAFDNDACIRLSYTLPEAELRDALGILVRALSERA
jgi:aspartate aminotransferase